MKAELIKTKDGSHSLFVPELNEIYHSTNGAIQESNHIFIDTALKQIDKKEISIFEVGFGTGLNALLTLDFGNKNNISINYYTIEKFPVNPKILNQLNYVELINQQLERDFIRMHQVDWNATFEINPNFILTKYKKDLLDFTPEFNYDIIYFDAFAPDIHPLLWSRNIFQTLFDHLNPGGVFTTYSAKGEVKRNLQAVGFDVKRIPGPPGKREITRAIKPF